MFAAIINGVQISIPTAIFTSDKTIARQSPPVAKKALITGGITQMTETATGFTNSAMVAKYAIVAITQGAKIIGIMYKGFKTIGTPNITGSLILKIPGAILSCATFFNSARLENNRMAPSIIKVAPEPPINTKALKLPDTHLNGQGSPIWKAFIF